MNFRFEFGYPLERNERLRAEEETEREREKRERREREKREKREERRKKLSRRGLHVASGEE